MTERNPIDKYSRVAYQDSLDRLSETEKKMNEHPLHAELAVHQELKHEAEAPYPLAEEEAQMAAAFEAETVDFRKEVDMIKRDLWRQLSNAQTEAMAINDERESREAAQVVLPQIAQIEDNTHHRMDDDPENLSSRAKVYGRAVLEIAEEAKYKIASEKPTPPPAVIQAIFRAVQELYSQFVGFAGNVLVQDKYGHAT